MRVCPNPPARRASRHAEDLSVALVIDDMSSSFSLVNDDMSICPLFFVLLALGLVP